MTFWLDLSEQFTSANSFMQTANFPLNIPSFTDAAFFPVQHQIYQYQGTLNKDINQTDPSEVLVFDTTTKKWSTEPQRGDKIIPAEDGSFVSVSEQNLGFWIGGVATSNDKSSAMTALNQMIRFDIVSREWSVEETGFAGRVRGNTVYVPIGDKGMLVSFAGGEFAGSTTVAVTLDQVEVYDIASGKWYSQQTGGDSNTDAHGNIFPSGRLNPCSIVVNARNSNYHVYMFGGALTPDSSSVAFDDIWVLTIPDFRWKSVGKKDVGLWDARCHLAGNSQVILVGGKASSGQCATSMLRVFDLNKLEFTDTFNPNGGDYRPNASLPDIAKDPKSVTDTAQNTVLHTGLAHIIPTATLTRSQSEFAHPANTSAALIIPVSSLKDTVSITTTVETSSKPKYENENIIIKCIKIFNGATSYRQYENNYENSQSIQNSKLSYSTHTHKQPFFYIIKFPDYKLH
ncbi:hypothetical protein AA313_de0200757 [Arthrobotrys entomopaga]|nr:hypothetical protein AA313_de0200757 [Arthrobotrys entomopaga]